MRAVSETVGKQYSKYMYAQQQSKYIPLSVVQKEFWGSSESPAENRVGNTATTHTHTQRISLCTGITAVTDPGFSTGKALLPGGRPMLHFATLFDKKSRETGIKIFGWIH